MLKLFVKSLIRASVVIVRRNPILLGAVKWMLARSGPLERFARKLVGKLFVSKQSISIQRLTNAQLRVLVDIKQSMNLYGRGRK